MAREHLINGTLTGEFSSALETALKERRIDPRCCDQPDCHVDNAPVVKREIDPRSGYNDGGSVRHEVTIYCASCGRVTSYTMNALVLRFG